jgi:eukaryotic-like serine/threonine-protein kinase
MIAQLSAALEGRYGIVRELGQGGMATVYLAEDLKHARRVALKVLKPELAAVLGADRFVVEIRTTAALQHPHILPLFDSGEAGGFLYYVMPFIDGETLRSRLDRETQLGVGEAVRIAVAVLDALDYAHRHGVVHRDIKPENILLQEGRPMVADFGIALAVSAAAGGRMTETGLSLGTPHYMSPEQATAAKEITGRSDIYSLASVLYEMLTGDPPHMGSSAQQIIMKIITENPQPVTAHRKSVPENVAAATARALEKLPADRFDSAKEFAAALGDTSFTFATHAQAMSSAAPAASRGRRALSMAPWVMLVIVTGLLASTPFIGSDEPPHVVRFAIASEPGVRISDGFGSPVAVSPDGSRIVLVGRDSRGVTHLFSRHTGSEAAVMIPGTANAHGPFISPDGNHLGFVQDSRIRRLAFAGGAAVTIAEDATTSTTWGVDGFVYTATATGLYRVPEAGGEPQLVVEMDTSRFEAMRWPDAVPDGRSVLVTVVRRGIPYIAVVSLKDRTIEELELVGMYPRYVNGGYLVFLQQDATLFSVPYDARRRRITGAPAPIANNVRFGPSFPGKLGVGRNGTVAYLDGQTTLREIGIVDRDGGKTTASAGGRFFQAPRFSPDGSQLAVVVSEFTAQTRANIWTLDLRTGSLSRVTFDSASSAGAWSGDGRRLTYFSRGAFIRIAVDGSGVAETLFTRPAAGVRQVDASRDGRILAWSEDGEGGQPDVYVATFDSAWVVRPLLRTPFIESLAALSPDGRLLAYTSDETGSIEVFVRKIAAGSGRWRVSTAGGHSPRWGGDGELFFRNMDTISVVKVTPGDELRIGEPRALLATGFAWGGGYTHYDVSPDGLRFALARTEGVDDLIRMHVVVNWFENQRTGSSRRR